MLTFGNIGVFSVGSIKGPIFVKVLMKGVVFFNLQTFAASVTEMPCRVEVVDQA